MSALSELLESSLPEGWSRRQVARMARARGHRLSDATAVAYFGARHGVPDDETLVAFADVLNVPIDQVRRAAGVRAPGEPWVPSPLSRYLREDQRAVLDQLIAVMVDRQDGASG